MDIFRLEDGILNEIKSLIKIVVLNVWSLPASSVSLISASLDFIQSVVTYNLCTGDLKDVLEKSIVSMTGMLKWSEVDSKV